MARDALLCLCCIEPAQRFEVLALGLYMQCHGLPC